MQLPEHPSPLILLPSSHCSPASRTWLPQTGRKSVVEVVVDAMVVVVVVCEVEVVVLVVIVVVVVCEVEVVVCEVEVVVLVEVVVDVLVGTHFPSVHTESQGHSRSAYPHLS